ncbi:MAG: hypothetical protein ACKOUM_02870, partial [Sphingopyxis sp.]
GLLELVLREQSARLLSRGLTHTFYSRTDPEEGAAHLFGNDGAKQSRVSEEIDLSSIYTTGPKAKIHETLDRWRVKMQDRYLSELAPLHRAAWLPCSFNPLPRKCGEIAHARIFCAFAMVLRHVGPALTKF